MTKVGRYDNQILRFERMLQNINVEQVNQILNEVFVIYDGHVSELSIESRQIVLGLIINHLKDSLTPTMVEYLEIIINTECELAVGSNNTSLFNQQTLHLLIFLTKDKLEQYYNDQHNNQTLDQMLLIVHRYIVKCAEYSVFCSQHQFKEILTENVTQTSLKFASSLLEPLENIDEDVAFDIMSVAVNNVNEQNIISVISIIRMLMKRNNSLLYKILDEHVTFYQISYLCFTSASNDGIIQLIQLLQEITAILKFQYASQISACKFVYDILKPIEVLEENQRFNNIMQKIEFINVIINIIHILNDIPDNGETNIWQYMAISSIMDFYFYWIQDDVKISADKFNDNAYMIQSKIRDNKSASFSKFCKLLSFILSNYQIQSEEIKQQQLNDDLYASNILLGIKLIQRFYQEFTKCFCRLYMSIDRSITFEKQVFLYLIIKQLHNEMINIITTKLKLSENIFEILVFKMQLFSNIASVIPEVMITILNNYELDIAIQECKFQAQQQNLTQKDMNEEMFLCYLDLTERENLLRQFYTPIIASIYHVSPGIYYNTVASYLFQVIIQKLDILDGTSVLYQENQAYQYKYNPYLLKQYHGIIQLQNIPFCKLNQLLVELMGFTPEFIYPHGLKQLTGIQNCLNMALGVFFFTQRSGLLNSKLVNEFIIKTTVILNKYGQTDRDFEREKLFYSLQTLIIFMENEYYTADTLILEPNCILAKEINLQALNKINDGILKYKQETQKQENDIINLVSIIKAEFKCPREHPRVHFMSLLFVICYYPLSNQGMRQYLASVIKLFCIGINRNCVFSRSFIAQLWTGKLILPDSIGLKFNDFSFLLRDSELFLANVTQIEIQQLIRTCNGVVQQYNISFNDIATFQEKLKYISIHEKQISKPVGSIPTVNQHQNVKSENVNESQQHSDMVNQSQNNPNVFQNQYDINVPIKPNIPQDRQETQFQLTCCDIPIRTMLTRILLMPESEDADIFNNFMHLSVAPTNLQSCGPNYIHAKSVLRGKRYAIQLQADIINFQHPCSLKITADCCLNIISLYRHLVDNSVNQGTQDFNFYCQNNLRLNDCNCNEQSKSLIFQQIMMREDEKIDVSYNSILYYAILWLQEQQVYASCYDTFNKDTYDQKNVSKLYKIVENCWSIIHKQYSINKKSSGINLTLLVACTLLIQNLVESYSRLQFYIVNSVNIHGGQEFINDVLQTVLELLTNKKVNGVIQTQNIQSYLLKTLINIAKTKTTENKLQLYIKPILLSVIKKPFDYIIQYKFLDFIKQLIIEYEKDQLQDINQDQQVTNNIFKIQITEQEYKDLFNALAITLQLIHDPSSQYYLTELAKHQIHIQINVVLNLLFYKSEDQIAYHKMLHEVCCEVSADRGNYVLYDYAVMTTKYLYGLDGYPMIQRLLDSQVNKFGGSGQEKSELLVVKSMIFNNFNLDALVNRYHDMIQTDTQTGIILSCYMSQLLQAKIQFDHQTTQLMNQLVQHIQIQEHNEFRREYIQKFNILLGRQNNYTQDLIYETLFGQQHGIEFDVKIQRCLSFAIQQLIQQKDEFLIPLQRICFCAWICGSKLEYTDQILMLLKLLQQNNDEQSLKINFWVLQIIKQQNVNSNDTIDENIIQQLKNKLYNNTMMKNTLNGYQNYKKLYYVQEINFINDMNIMTITPITSYIDEMLNYEIIDKIICSSLALEIRFIIMLLINEKYGYTYKLLPQMAKVFNNLVNNATTYSNKQKKQDLHSIHVYVDLLYANSLTIEALKNITTEVESDTVSQKTSDESESHTSVDEIQVNDMAEQVQSEPTFYLQECPNLQLPVQANAPITWNYIRQLQAQNIQSDNFYDVQRALNLKTLAKLQYRISILLNELHITVCAKVNPDGLEMSLKMHSPQSSHIAQQTQQNIINNSATSGNQIPQKSQSGQQTAYASNQTMKGIWTSDSESILQIVTQLIQLLNTFTQIAYEVFKDIENTFWSNRNILDTFFFIRDEKFRDFESAIRASGNAEFKLKAPNMQEDSHHLYEKFESVIKEISFWTSRISLLVFNQPIVLVELANTIDNNTLINKYVDNLLRYHDAIGRLIYLGMLRVHSSIESSSLQNDSDNYQLSTSSTYNIILTQDDQDLFILNKQLLSRLKTIYSVKCTHFLLNPGVLSSYGQNGDISSQENDQDICDQPHRPTNLNSLSIMQLCFERLELLYEHSQIGAKQTISIYNITTQKTIEVEYWVKQIQQRPDELLIIEDVLYNAQSGCMALSAWMYAAWTRLLVSLVECVYAANQQQSNIIKRSQQQIIKVMYNAIQRFSSRLSYIYMTSYIRHVYSNSFVQCPATILIVEANIFKLVRLFFSGGNIIKSYLSPQSLQGLCGPFYNDEVLQAIMLDLGIRTTLKNVTEMYVNIFLQQKAATTNTVSSSHGQNYARYGKPARSSDVDVGGSELPFNETFGTLIQQFREDNSYIGIYQDIDVSRSGQAAQGGQSATNLPGQSQSVPGEFWPLRLHNCIHYNEVVHGSPELCSDISSAIQVTTMRCLRLAKRAGKFRNIIQTLDSICGISSDFSAYLYSEIQQETFRAHCDCNEAKQVNSVNNNNADNANTYSFSGALGNHGLATYPEQSEIQAAPNVSGIAGSQVSEGLPILQPVGNAVTPRSHTGLQSGVSIPFIPMGTSMSVPPASLGAYLLPGAHVSTSTVPVAGAQIPSTGVTNNTDMAHTADISAEIIGSRRIRAQMIQQKLLSVALANVEHAKISERVSLPTVIINILAKSPRLFPMDFQSMLWLFKLSQLNSSDFTKQLAARSYQQMEKGMENGIRNSIKRFDFIHHKNYVAPDVSEIQLQNNYGLLLLMQRITALGHAGVPVQTGSGNVQSIIGIDFSVNEKATAQEAKTMKNTQITALNNLKQFYLKNLSADKQQLEQAFSEPFYKPFIEYLNNTDIESKNKHPGQTSEDIGDNIITSDQIAHGIGAQLCLQGVLMALYFLSKVRAQIDKLDISQQPPQIRSMYNKFKQEGQKIWSEFEECQAQQKELRKQQNALKVKKQDIDQRFSELSLQALVNTQNIDIQLDQNQFLYDQYVKYEDENHVKKQMAKQIEDINIQLHTIALRLMQAQKDIFCYYKRYFMNIYDLCNNILSIQDRKTQIHGMCQSYLNLNNIIVQLFQVDKTEIDTILVQNSISCMQHQILMQYLQQHNESELMMAYKIPYQIGYLSDNRPYAITSNSKILYPLQESDIKFQENIIHPSFYICKNSQIKLGAQKQTIQSPYMHDIHLFKNIITYKRTNMNFDILHFLSEFFRYSIEYTNKDVNLQFLCIQNNYADVINKIVSKQAITLDPYKFKARAYEQIYTGITQYIMNILRENVGESNHRWFNPQLIPSSFIYNFSFSGQDTQGASTQNSQIFINYYCEMMKLHQQQRQYQADHHLYESILQLNDYQLLEHLVYQQSPFKNPNIEEAMSKLNIVESSMQQQQNPIFSGGLQITSQNTFDSQNQRAGGSMHNTSDSAAMLQKDRTYAQLAMYFKKLLEQLRVNGMLDGQLFDMIIQRVTQDIGQNKQGIQQFIVQLQSLGIASQLQSIHNNIQNALPRNNMNIQWGIQSTHGLGMTQGNNNLYNQQQQQQLQQQQMAQLHQTLKQIQLQQQTQNISDFKQIIEQFLNSTFPGYNPQLFNVFIDKNAHFYNIISKLLNYDDQNHNVYNFIQNIHYKPSQLDFEECYGVERYRSMMESYSMLGVTYPAAFIQGIAFNGGIKRTLGKHILRTANEHDGSWVTGGDVNAFLPLSQLVQLSKRPNATAPGIYSVLLQSSTTQQLRQLQSIYSIILGQIKENQYNMQRSSYTDAGNNQHEQEQDSSYSRVHHQGSTLPTVAQQVQPTDGGTISTNYIAEMLQSDSELFYQDPETLLFMLIAAYNKYQENYQLIHKITMIFTHLVGQYSGKDIEAYNKYIPLHQEIVLLQQYSEHIYCTYTRQTNIQKVIEYIYQYQQRCFNVQRLDRLSNTQLNYICTIRLLILQVVNNVITGNTENLISDEQKYDLQVIKEKTLCMRLDTITAVSYLLRAKKCQKIAAYNIAKDVMSYIHTENILLGGNFLHAASVVAYYRCQIINTEGINAASAISMISSYKQIIRNANQHYGNISVSTENVCTSETHQILHLLTDSSREFDFIKSVIDSNQSYIEHGEYDDNLIASLTQQHQILQDTQIQQKRYYQHTLCYSQIIEHALHQQIRHTQCLTLSEEDKKQAMHNVYSLTEIYLNCLEEITSEHVYSISSSHFTAVDIQVFTLQKWIQFFLLPDEIYLQNSDSVMSMMQSNTQEYDLYNDQKQQSVSSSASCTNYLDICIKNHQDAIEKFGRLQIFPHAQLLIRSLAYSQQQRVMQQTIPVLLLLKLFLAETSLDKAQDSIIDKDMLQNQIDNILGQYNQVMRVLAYTEETNEIVSILTQVLPTQGAETIQLFTNLFQGTGNKTYDSIKRQIIAMQNALSPLGYVENMGKVFLAFLLKCVHPTEQHGCSLNEYIKQISVPPVVWIYTILNRIRTSQQAISKSSRLLDEVRQYYRETLQDSNVMLPDFDSIYKHTKCLFDKLSTEKIAGSLEKKLLKLKDLKSVFRSQQVKNYTGFIGSEDELHDNAWLSGMHGYQGSGAMSKAPSLPEASYIMHTKRHCYYQLTSRLLKVHMVDDYPAIQINFCNIQNDADRITMLLVQKPDSAHFISYPTLYQLLSQKVQLDDIYMHNRVYQQFVQLVSDNNSDSAPTAVGDVAQAWDYKHEIIENNYVQLFGYYGSYNVNQRFKQLAAVQPEDFQDLDSFKLFKTKLAKNAATFMLFNQLFWNPKRLRQITIGEKVVDLQEGRFVSCSKLNVILLPAAGAGPQQSADGLPIGQHVSDEVVDMYLGQVLAFRKSILGQPRLYQSVLLQNCFQQLWMDGQPNIEGGVQATDAQQQFSQERASVSAAQKQSLDPVKKQPEALDVPLLPNLPAIPAGIPFAKNSVPVNAQAELHQHHISNNRDIHVLPASNANTQGPITTPQPGHQSDQAAVNTAQTIDAIATCLDTSFLHMMTPEFAIGHLSRQIGEQLKTIQHKNESLFSDTIMPVHMRGDNALTVCYTFSMQVKQALVTLKDWLIGIVYEMALSQPVISPKFGRKNDENAVQTHVNVVGTADLLAQQLSPLAATMEEPYGVGVQTQLQDNEKLNPVIEFVLSCISSGYT